VAYGGAAGTATRRAKIVAAWSVITPYEQMLVERLIEGLQAIPGVHIYGITNPADWQQRMATVSIRKDGTTPTQLAEALAVENIFAWNGNFYAVSLSERLGVEADGGLLRLGLVHYNTVEEIDTCLRVIEHV